VLICYDEDDCQRVCQNRKKRSTVKNNSNKLIEKVVTSGLLRLERSQPESVEEIESEIPKHVKLPVSLNFGLLVVVLAFIVIAVYATKSIEEEERNQVGDTRGFSNTAFSE